MARRTQAERLEALANHLLDGFLHLRERYALLKPMLFDPELAKRRGSGLQGRGYSTLRYSLFLSCVQDVAKFILDADSRTPSIHVIVGALNDAGVRQGFKERYAVWNLPVLNVDDDPAILEALARMEAAEEGERRIKFDEHWRDLDALWNELRADPAVQGFRTIGTSSRLTQRFGTSRTSTRRLR